jgi:hypothetical protein
MYGQVYQSFSNSDHNVTFANHVGRHGLSLWPWIISHRHSQADVGGPLACTFIALEFIRLVLVNPCLQAGILRRGDDLGPVLAALLQENIFQVRETLKYNLEHFLTEELADIASRLRSARRRCPDGKP